MLQSFSSTHVGLVRKRNEDTFVCLEDKRFYAIADGMGGHKAGDVAAQKALSHLESLIQATTHETLEEACQILREAITSANREIFGTALSLPTCKGMGTTLCCFTLTDNHLIYGHVGDSRLYRYRDRLTLLTRDHSVKGNRQLLPSHPLYKYRHTITRALGLHPMILPDIGILPIQKNDIYMLCSDGLSDDVPLSLMDAILASPLTLEQKAEKLTQAALEKGGRDNITLTLVKIDDAT